MEQAPRMWWAALCTALKELSSHPELRARGLGGISVSGQQHGFVPLDADGDVIRPAKLWCDRSTASEAEELSQRWGWNLPVGFTASKILWLKRHEPQHFARLRHVLLPHDYLNWMLTGRLWMECGDASGTGLLDISTRQFDSARCASVDGQLLNMLPELLGPCAIGGHLTATAARATGLPEGTPVAVGSGDNMLSALGAGAAETGPVIMSLGTSATVMARSPKPVIDPRGLIAPFADCTGAWLPLLCVMNAAGALDQFAASLGSTTEECCAAAARVPVGSDGITCLPFFNGERVPDLPQACASFDGLSAANTRSEHLFRAVLEGITCNLTLGLRRMERLGVPVKGLRLVGGGARFALWRQMLADATGLPIVRPVESESAALGAAIQAAYAVGGGAVPLAELARPCVALNEELIEPDSSAVQAWDALRQRFTDVLSSRYGASASG
jgi:D-xylulose kinase